MSISAQISKKVVFSSVEEFYNYLRTRHSLKSECLEFTTFYDTLFLAKNGCPCNTEELENYATQMYKVFDKIDSKIWDIVKDNIQCDKIIFKLNNEILFEF